MVYLWYICSTSIVYPIVYPMYVYGISVVFIYIYGISMYIHALLIIIASYLYSGMLQKDYQVHLAKCKGGQEEGPMGTRQLHQGGQ